VAGRVSTIPMRTDSIHDASKMNDHEECLAQDALKLLAEAHLRCHCAQPA